MANVSQYRVDQTGIAMKIKICVTLILNSFECFLKRLSFTKQKKIRIKSQFHLQYIFNETINWR